MNKRTCTNDSCKKCDLAYIIANYVTPLMQCLTNDIKDFNMQLITTKCLNTAVMLMFFLLGKKGLKRAHHCDSSKVYQRYVSGTSDNNTTISQMRKNILNKSVKNRYIYYILMNDGYFPHPEGNKYFPGHVFILEKIPATENQPLFFNVYQSYINQYDLKGYLHHRDNTFQYSHDQVKTLLSRLQYILNTDKWDDKCIMYWKDFTHVDTETLRGSSPKQTLSICFTYDKVFNCIENIEKYAIKKLSETATKKSTKRKDIYGNKSVYSNRAQPLTVDEMQNKLTNIIYDIHKMKNNI